MKKTKKKKTKKEIIKRREFILKFLVYFIFFSIVIPLSVGAILEDKGKILNTDADTYSTLIILYGSLMLLLTYLLSAKWGATKGGYHLPGFAAYGFGVDIMPKIGVEKEYKKNITSYEELLMHFEKSKYDKSKIKIKKHNAVMYCNDIYCCINSYVLIKSNKNILEDMEDIKKKCSEKLSNYVTNRLVLSYNLMIIIYSNDKLDYKEFMAKLDITKLCRHSELIIPGLIENNKLKYLNYIKGPMEQNYYLCIKELKKILKKKIN